MVENTYGSCRGPGLRSQHSHGGSHQSISAASGDLSPSSVPIGTRHARVWMCFCQCRPSNGAGLIQGGGRGKLAKTHASGSELSQNKGRQTKRDRNSEFRQI